MKDRTDSILGLIGLATKAGKTAAGEAACELAIKMEKTKLVILAKDASDNTKKPIIRLCGYHGTAVREFTTKEMLGRFTGKALRATVGITDPGFAARILELIDQTQERVDSPPDPTETPSTGEDRKPNG